MSTHTLKAPPGGPLGGRQLLADLLAAARPSVIVYRRDWQESPIGHYQAARTRLDQQYGAIERPAVVRSRPRLQLPGDLLGDGALDGSSFLT